MKILHISTDLKFITPFVEIINKYDKINQHKFIFISKEKKIKRQDNIVFINKKSQVIRLILDLNSNNQIILHGLFSNVILKILLIQPWIFKKCYWVMHGGDFYFPKEQNWIKRHVIRKIKHFITYIKDDFEYVKKWYGAEGKYHECFMYPSNLYKQHNLKKRTRNTLNIQVGNSADPTNNHLEIFEFLKKDKHKNIKIYAPLNYGNQNYAKKVISKGKKIFGNKFVPITKFMPSNLYIDFLTDIDIAIFAHKRQQAMGNIITLLGLGKKVYVRDSISSWQFFKDINVKLFNYHNIQLEVLNNSTKEANMKKIRSYFSEETYIRQLRDFLI